MICLCSDTLLETRADTEDDSVPKSTVEKPPSTPDMDAHEAEEMANCMLLNSPLPDVEWSDERLPKGDGSDKLLVITAVRVGNIWSTSALGISM